MAVTFRSIVLAIVPSFAVVIGGFFWFQRRRKQDRHLEFPKPPDKTESSLKTENSTKDIVTSPESVLDPHASPQHALNSQASLQPAPSPQACPKPAPSPQSSPKTAPNPQASLQPAPSPQASLQPAPSPQASLQPALSLQASPMSALSPQASPQPGPSPSAFPPPNTNLEASLQPAPNPQASPQPVLSPQTSLQPSLSVQASPISALSPQASPQPVPSPLASPQPNTNLEASQQTAPNTQTSPQAALGPQASLQPALSPHASLQPALNPQASLQPALSSHATPQPALSPQASLQPAPGMLASPNPALSPKASPQPAPSPEVNLQPFPSPQASPKPAPIPPASPHPLLRPQEPVETALTLQEPLEPAPSPQIPPQLSPSQQATPKSAPTSSVTPEECAAPSHGLTSSWLSDSDISESLRIVDTKSENGDAEDHADVASFPVESTSQQEDITNKDFVVSEEPVIEEVMSSCINAACMAAPPTDTKRNTRGNDNVCSKDGDLDNACDSSVCERPTQETLCGQGSLDWAREADESSAEELPSEAVQNEEGGAIEGCGQAVGGARSPVIDSPHSMTSDSTDTHSDLSNDSGRASSINEVPTTIPEETDHSQIRTYEFDFPSDLIGMLIGRQGRSINHIKEHSGAEITIKNKLYTTEAQLVSLTGTSQQIEKALAVVKSKFPRSRFQRYELDFEEAQPECPILAPEIMQLSLAEGVMLEALVSSVVSANHIFLQQPTHPSFPMMEVLKQCMQSCYMNDNVIPELPRPIEVGVICAAPMYDSWFRAQVVQSYVDTDECLVKFVDYGGFLNLPGCMLKQIRSDFTSLPFQATECYLANVMPTNDGEEFDVESTAGLEELVRGHLLQAEVVSHDDDGTPYVNLYFMENNKSWLINRALVERGLAGWAEQQ